MLKAPNIRGAPSVATSTAGDTSRNYDKSSTTLKNTQENTQENTKTAGSSPDEYSKSTTATVGSPTTAEIGRASVSRPQLATGLTTPKSGVSVRSSQHGKKREVDLDDPQLLNNRVTDEGHGNAGITRYQAVDGDVFVDGVAADDVNQGAISDCYFVAVVSSIAAAAPEIIEKMVAKNPDGTFTVTFKEPLDNNDSSALEQFRSVAVTVDADLPVNDRGELVYLRPGGALGTPAKTELWGPILEKAYAQYREQTDENSQQKGYNTIGNRGFASSVYASFYGKSPQQFSPVRTDGTVDPKELCWLLKHYMDQGQAITVRFNNSVDDLTANKAPEAVGKMGRLKTLHTYSVLGVEPNPAGSYDVVLRNPWGFFEPGDDGHNDGIFRLSASALASFAAYFDVAQR